VTSAVAAPPPVQGGPPTPAGNAAAKPSAFARREAAHDFANSVSSPSSLSARQVLHISLLALLALALLALPIALVNDTALLNAAELALLARRLRRRLRLDELGRRTERLPLAAGLLATSVTGGLLYALLVPSVGWDRSTLALVLGLSVGLLLIATTATLTQRAVLNRFAEASRLQLYPGFALLAAACVLVSRLAGLRPGLLLGTLLSLAAVRQLRAEVDGRAKATALAALALLTATGWAVRGHLVVAAGHAGAFAADVVAVIVSSVVIGGAQTLAFEVLPLAFFDGLVIYRWSKAAWAALATFGAAAFVEVLLRPRASTASLVNRTEYLLLLLGSYLVIALGFWGWFRYRPDRFRPLIVEDELADAAGRPSPGAR
jgi:hypothetical protein